VAIASNAPSEFDPNVVVSPDHSPKQSSHASKRLKTEAHHALDKGKATAAPSSPSNGSDKSVSSRMHLRDDCSHVISEIRPKGSAQPKANSGKSRGDNSNQGRVASQTGNMVSSFFYYIYCSMTVDFGDIWIACLFWIYEYYFEIISNFMSFNYQK
jgi:hypothetical protein